MTKMSHIKTLFPGNLNNYSESMGCGECQTSCQSACKTSCTVANQNCEQDKNAAPTRTASPSQKIQLTSL